MSLGNNPWQCTCELRWLQQFRSHIFPPHLSSEVALCEGPENVAFRALAVLRPDQLLCIEPQIVHCDPVS